VKYEEKAIKEYLRELASRAPAPGGGSASALVGAIGASCLLKAVNFTLGNEKYESVSSDMKKILKGAERIKGNFEKLSSEDVRAYGELSEAFKLPKGAERASRVQAALKEAMRVPLEICGNACEAVKLCPVVREKGNRNLVSDVDCAESMLKCAYDAALINVRVNLKCINDKAFCEETQTTLEKMEGEIK